MADQPTRASKEIQIQGRFQPCQKRCRPCVNSAVHYTEVKNKGIFNYPLILRTSWLALVYCLSRNAISQLFSVFSLPVLQG